MGSPSKTPAAPSRSWDDPGCGEISDNIEMDKQSGDLEVEVSISYRNVSKEKELRLTKVNQRILSSANHVRN